MFKRAQRPPAFVRAAVAERPLAWAALDGDRWLVLARSELALLTGEALTWRRPWHEVERGEWDGERHALTVHWVGVPEPDVLVTVEERPRDLPLTFRERVEASVVHSESERAVGGGRLRAVVRRTPEGELLTQVLAVGRVQPGPALDAQIDALEAKVRDAVGL
ncbi:hypothetical protein [Pseudactinotalea suaedae]|uniref:hypothetical protein n=1 Tax=Pseudactinotalea suaedae TaxID=1524924 RepID=UPI0012E18AB0|nr:hypothetical protein [Pseudactinotalea suaedae]